MKMETRADFIAFYRALHGSNPPAWLKELSSWILHEGQWPVGINRPAPVDQPGLLDAAVFTLAQAWRQQPRKLALRLFITANRHFVFDPLLDYAYQLASRLKEALGDTSQLGLAPVAASLAQLGGSITPLLVSSSFCKTAGLEAWTRNPRQPAIIFTTHRELGSWLLFRGQGARPDQWPTLAGLAGMDAHLWIDDALLENSFLNAIQWIQKAQARAARPPLRGLTYTVFNPSPIFHSPVLEDNPSSLRSEWKPNHLHPQPATLVCVEEKSWLNVLQREVQRLTRVPVKTVGIVMNSHEKARSAWQWLRQHGQIQTILVTARTRPCDARILELVHLRPPASHSSSPLVLVGTQALEGAPVLFDRLITQVAPLPVLVQRFRLLQDSEPDPGSSGTILDFKEEDPVYGDLSAVGQFLGKQSPLDFSPQAIKRWRDWPPLPDTGGPPLLFPHAELFAYTAPLPQANPDVSCYIHGIRADLTELHVGWRRELDQAPQQAWPELLQQMPPVPSELLSLPLVTFQAWCHQQPDRGLSDLQSSVAEPAWSETNPRIAQVLRLSALGKRDQSRFEIVPVRALQPGDIVILPASLGGCDEFGWNPAAAATEDVYEPSTRQDNACFPEEVFPRIRLSKDRISPVHWRRLLRQKGTQCPDVSQVKDLLPGIDLSGYRTQWYPSRDPIGLLLSRGASHQRPGSQTNAPRLIPLQSHLEGVAQNALTLSEPCIADASLRKVLAQAGMQHDLGLADPRCQGDFRAQYPAGRLPEALLVKPPGDEESWNYPSLRGYRHEMLSVKWYLQSGGGPLELDPVAYLAGTHHGHGRPAFPKSKSAPIAFSLDLLQTDTDASLLQAADSGWFELVDKMHETYGLWGTAYLEAILQAADQLQNQRDLQQPAAPTRLTYYSFASTAGKPPSFALPIPGLKAYHPAQFLAALGLILRCSHLPGLKESQLSWLKEPGYTACLHTPERLTLEQLAHRITEQQADWLNKPIDWLEQTVGITSHPFPVFDLRELAMHIGPEEQKYLAGYLRLRPGQCPKHPLIQVCGPLRLEMALLRNEQLLGREQLGRVLLGQGKPEPGCYSFGLCPDTWLPNYVSPRSLQLKNGVPWLMQLAMDGFYFLPASCQRMTLFWNHRLLWPVWRRPLSRIAMSRFLQVHYRFGPEDLYCRYEARQEAWTKGLSLLAWSREVPPSGDAATTMMTCHAA